MATIPGTAEAEPSTTPGVRWTLARQVLGVTLLLPLALLLLLFGGDPLFFPPVGILVALQLVSLGVLAWRNTRWAALGGGLSLFLLAALNIPFLGPEALRPDHGLMFIGAVSIIATGLVGIVAGVAAFLETRRPAISAARWGTPGAVATLVVAGILLGTGFAGYAATLVPATGAGAVALTPDATVSITVVDFVFPRVTIPADQVVKITITNADTDPHTFTVPGLGIDAELPGGKSVDVWVKAAPGTYFLYCAPHSDGMEDDGSGMVGEIVAQ